MAAQQDLLAELAAAIERHDTDAMRAARQALCEQYSAAPEAAEAQYRLGLDALFVGRDIDRAMAYFEEACRSKHPTWAPAARTSLGLCLLHLGRSQKGMFELRKVAFAKDATAHSVTALTLLESLCATHSQAEEALRVRKERISQLERLLTQPQLSPTVRGQYLLQLGLACADAGDKPRASKAFSEAHGLGAEVLGAEAHALAAANLP